MPLAVKRTIGEKAIQYHYPQLLRTLTLLLLPDCEVQRGVKLVSICLVLTILPLKRRTVLIQRSGFYLKFRLRNNCCAVSESSRYCSLTAAVCEARRDVETRSDLIVKLPYFTVQTNAAGSSAKRMKTSVSNNAHVMCVPSFCVPCQPSAGSLDSNRAHPEILSNFH